MMTKKIANKYLWISEEQGKYRVGFTNEGQEELGNITFITLPKLGTSLEKDASFADVEAEKAVTELVSPINGKVIEIREEVLDNPSLLDNANEEEAWILVLSDVSEEEFNLL